MTTADHIVGGLMVAVSVFWLARHLWQANQTINRALVRVDQESRDRHPSARGR